MENQEHSDVFRPNFKILNSMYAVSNEMEMKVFLFKYEQLAQESLEKLISFLSKLNSEILHYMEENGIDPSEPNHE